MYIGYTIDDYKDKSYQELIKIRKEIIAGIEEYENKPHNEDECVIRPSPEVIYKVDMMRLKELIEYMMLRFDEDNQ